MRLLSVIRRVSVEGDIYEVAICNKEGISRRGYEVAIYNKEGISRRGYEVAICNKEGISRRGMRLLSVIRKAAILRSYYVLLLRL